MASKKQEIYQWVKKLKRTSTTKVAALSGLPNNYARRYLEQIEKEGLIKREEETNATYWRLA